MIVEDNPEMRRLIRSLLCDLASAVSECDDGAEALAAYAAHRPDWVLMDIKMQQMDGITATRELKSNFPEARVLIVTDYDDADMREAARCAGAIGYVLKEDLLGLRQMLKAAA
jgi:CheY-like chemotaxis protein